MELEPIYAGNKIRFGKLFAATWQVYRTHIIPILALTLIGALPFLYDIYTGRTMSRELTFVSFIFSTACGELLWLLPFMSIINIVDDIVAGRPTNTMTSVKKAVFRLPAAIITKLLSLTMLLGWFLLLIIPGIIKTIRYSLSTQAVTLRKVANLEAIRYSVKLVDDYWWSVVIADFLIGFLPGFVLFIPFSVKGPGMLFNPQRFFLVVTVVQILSTGFRYVGETLLFLALERIKTGAADGNVS